ncbi:MAG: DUF4270 family protein [Bacteroidia bacterium]
MGSDLNRFFNTVLPRSSGAKFFILAAVVLLASCKKESNIGAELIPDGDLLNVQYTDTLTLLTQTQREDSIRTDEAPKFMIGSYVDPVFGKSTAGLFTQLTIPNNLLNINFGSGAVLDSTVLQLSYNFDYYGDTTSTQTFKVYQMTEALHKDSLYYSNRAKQYYPVAVGAKTFQPQPRTKVPVNGDTLPAHLRIPLDPSFGQLIFSQSGGTNLSSNAAFQEYLKGLYVAPETPSQSVNEGAIMYFNPTDTLSRLTLYYHTATDTLRFSFVINSSTAYYNYFTHDFTQATQGDVVQQISNPGQFGWNETYVQAMSGLRTKIMFPYLNNLNNLGYRISINKAELVVKGDASQATSNYPLNKQMYLVSIDSTGKQRLLLDMFENSVYYGGELNTTTNEYRINLARHFQAMLNGDEPNLGLYLKEIYPAENARRSVIGGASATSSNKMYLRIVYTVIN